MREIIIDPEFSKLLRKHTAEEIEDLRENLKKNGCLDDVIVWKETGILVEGHLRHQLCLELGIEFGVTEMSFENRTEVKKFMRRFQTGRRNVTPQMASFLRGKEYIKRKKKHGGNKRKKPIKQGAPEVQTFALETGKTGELIGEEEGVAESTVRNDAEFAEAVETVAGDDEEVKASLLSGDITKQQTIFLGTLSRAKRLELLGKEQQAPGAILTAMKRKGRSPKASANGKPEKDRRKEAQKALGVIIRYLSAKKLLEPNRAMIDKLNSILQA